MGCFDAVARMFRRILRHYTRFSEVHPRHSRSSPLHSAQQSRHVLPRNHRHHPFSLFRCRRQNATYPLTALAAYGRPECLAGFVIGTPSLPDLNMGQQPVAYDLVCPTCYQHDLIQRSLDFRTRKLKLSAVANRSTTSPPEPFILVIRCGSPALPLQNNLQSGQRPCARYQLRVVQNMMIYKKSILKISLDNSIKLFI